MPGSNNPPSPPNLLPLLFQGKQGNLLLHAHVHVWHVNLTIAKKHPCRYGPVGALATAHNSTQVIQAFLEALHPLWDVICACGKHFVKNRLALHLM